MRKVILSISLLSIGLVACKNTKQSSNTTEVKSNDVEEVVDMHTAEIALSYCGIYQGVIPAADAPGIQVTLILNDDNTFEIQETFLEKEDGDFQEKGAYLIEGNVLTLFREHDEKFYYKIEEGRLKMLTRDQEEVEGPLAAQYILEQIEVFE